MDLKAISVYNNSIQIFVYLVSKLYFNIDVEVGGQTFFFGIRTLVEFFEIATQTPGPCFQSLDTTN